MPRGVTTTRPAAGIKLSVLADDVQAFLGGTPISLIMEVAPDGTAVIDVRSPDGSFDPAITPAELRALVNAHVVPPPPVDSLDTLATALAAASTLPQLKAALLDWAGAERRTRPPQGPRP